MNRPVGGTVVAIIWQEVKVKLPKDVQGDAAIRCRHVVVGFPEHGIKTVQGHVFGQQPVSQSIYFQQPLKLLEKLIMNEKTEKM